MHFRHISAKVQPKNLKQHFDWGPGPPEPPSYALARNIMCFIMNVITARQEYLAHPIYLSFSKYSYRQIMFKAGIQVQIRLKYDDFNEKL